MEGDTELSKIFRDETLLTKMAEKLGVEKEAFVSQNQLDTVTELVLNVDSLSSIKGMELLTKLQTLEINGMKAALGLSDLSPLDNADELVTLTISNANIGNVTPLKFLPNSGRELDAYHAFSFRVVDEFGENNNNSTVFAKNLNGVEINSDDNVAEGESRSGKILFIIKDDVKELTASVDSLRPDDRQSIDLKIMG